MFFTKDYYLIFIVLILSLFLFNIISFHNSSATIADNSGNTPLDTNIVIPSTNVNLIEDKGVLLVNTIVNDKTNLDNNIVFDHSNVRSKVIAGNPNPETFIVKENSPTSVILDPGNYDIQVFLEFDFDEDGIITSIDITDFQDIKVDNENNRLLELNNCKGGIVEGQQQVCTVEITITDAISTDLLGGELEGDLIGNTDSDTDNQLLGEVEGRVSSTENLLQFRQCDVYNPDKVRYVFQGEIDNNIYTLNSMNNNKKKDISIHLSNLNNILNNESKLEGSIFITQNNVSDLAVFTLNETYTECIDDSNNLPQKNKIFQKLFEYPCEIKRLFVNGNTYASFVQQDSKLKKFNLEITMKQINSKGSILIPDNEANLSIGNDRIHLNDVKVQDSCIIF